jgi:hypothetical protein
VKSSFGGNPFHLRGEWRLGSKTEAWEQLWRRILSEVITETKPDYSQGVETKEDFKGAEGS